MAAHPANLVLLCFDGSEPAREAIVKAAGILRERRALVLHVYRSAQELAIPYGGVAFGRETPNIAKEIMEHAHGVAEQGARLAREAGFDAEALHVEAHGRIPDTILDVARDRDAAVIVTGSRGLGGVKLALLGSVSAGLLHGADRPVLVLPPGS
jgi:nucleotide-binding universal stress UspA family protein